VHNIHGAEKAPSSVKKDSKPLEEYMAIARDSKREGKLSGSGLLMMEQAFAKLQKIKKRS